MLTEGISNQLKVQAETAFAGDSAETVYAVPAKISFRWQPVHGGGSTRRNVWRQQSDNTFATRHYRGTLEMDLGINLATKLLLDSFCELKATTNLGGGLMQYDYRPRRVADFSSLKIGLEYAPGGPNYIFHGTVVDKLTFAVSLRQPTRLTVEFQSALKESETLGDATAILERTTDHVHTAVELDTVPLTHLQEASFNMGDPKEPGRFGRDKAPTMFYGTGKMTFGGSLMELMHSESVLHTKVETLAEGAVEIRCEDPFNANRFLLASFPRTSFVSGTPDGIARNDLVTRAEFAGLQDTNLDPGSEALLTLIV